MGIISVSVALEVCTHSAYNYLDYIFHREMRQLIFFFFVTLLRNIRFKIFCIVWIPN